MFKRLQKKFLRYRLITDLGRDIGNNHVEFLIGHYLYSHTPYRRRVFNIILFDILVKDKYVFLREFQKVLRRGVDVRIILTGPPEKNWDLVQAYLQAGIKMKYLPLDNFSLVVVDEQECKITLKSKSYQQKFNIYIQDHSFSKAMHSYYQDLWAQASPLDTNMIKKK